MLKAEKNSKEFLPQKLSTVSLPSASEKWTDSSKENVKSKEIFERKFGRKSSPLIFALPFKKRGCSSKEMQKAEEILK